MPDCCGQETDQQTCKPHSGKCGNSVAQENRSTVDGPLLSRPDIKQAVQTIVTGRHVLDAGIGEREPRGRLRIRSQERVVDAQRGLLTAGLCADNVGAFSSRSGKEPEGISRLFWTRCLESRFRTLIMR